MRSVSNHSQLVNHHYLLARSGLPWAVALLLFLAVWQVMVLGMMLPSTLPLLRSAGDADTGIRGGIARLWVVQAVFLAGYAAIWTEFAAAAFMGDTLLHALVHGWP